MKLTILFWSVIGLASSYAPPAKESLLSGLFLRDLVERLNSNKMSDMSYLDLTDGLPLDGRSLTQQLEGERMLPLDYDSLGDINIHPSIRDQELLEHSKIWGSQYVPGGAGEETELLKSKGFTSKHEMKTDTLPAYCNPPNPCPVGYSAENGCIEKFENTAYYSRTYQASQDCMCDTEHMFECPNPAVAVEDEDELDPIDHMELSRFIESHFKIPSFPRNNMGVSNYGYKQIVRDNPFLSGEKLPVAAKKGNKVVFY